MRDRRRDSSFNATFDGAAAWGGCVLAIGLFSFDLDVIDSFAFGLGTAAQAQPISAPAVERTELVRVHTMRCREMQGVGSAPTERLARLQAWERVAQATGNWPVVSDTFRRERYQCERAGPKPGPLWHCRSSIDVCRST